MKYLSTRGHADRKQFCEILLEGLAPDGGLYLPTRIPRLAAADLGIAMGSGTDAAIAASDLTIVSGDLLVVADRMSMAHSLEVRVPLIDRPVVEFAGRVPALDLTAAPRPSRSARCRSGRATAAAISPVSPTSAPACSRRSGTSTASARCRRPTGRSTACCASTRASTPTRWPNG